MKNISERVLHILEWPQLLIELQKRSITSGGKFLCTNLDALEFSKGREQIALISVIKELMLKGEVLSFDGLVDVSDLCVRAEKGSVLSLEEVSSVRSSLLRGEQIILFLSEWKHDYPQLESQLQGLIPLGNLTEDLKKSITDEGNLNLKRFPEIRRLQDSLSSVKRDVEKRLHSMVHSPEMEKVMQEKIVTTVNQRYVVLVKSGQKGKVSGTVQDVSSSGATFYVEPAGVNDLNNRLIALHADLQREISRVLAEITEKIGAMSSEIIANQRVHHYLDFITACSRFSRDTMGNAPELVEDVSILLYRARHPLLYLMMGDDVVANDIELGREYSSIIISGANTGGKTVLLKTLGLNVLMGLCGLHISGGPDSQIGQITSLFGDMGDDQSLEQSLSTFSGQLVVINDIIENATKGSLVLLDEIIVGTNPRQGASLAQAILEAITDKGALLIVTTHYSELKELASADKRFVNASVSFDLETLKPTYRLTVGVPGVSYAMEIARLYGMNHELLSRAEGLFDSRDLSVESLLEELQRYREQMEEEHFQIDSLKNELQTAKTKLDIKERDLETMKVQLKQQKGVDFIDELEGYRKEVAGRIKDLQQVNLKEAGDIQRDLINLEGSVSQRLRSEREHHLTRELKPLNAEDIEKGMVVFVASLEKTGTVEEVTRNGESVLVLFGGSIRSRFPIEEIFHASVAHKQKDMQQKKKPRYSDDIHEMPASVSLTIQTSYNTIDLRGKRVDESIILLEEELDRMTRGGISAAVIIHGHGTGALREAVRQHLPGTLYVSSFRAGELGEGGDGVTIAQLKR
jgi:DNA mismatch repair protein MutS2